MDDRIARRLQEDMDKLIFGCTTVSNPAPAEPLTIDTLRKMMLKMPPCETWLSSRLFPSGSAFCVKGSGENFTCAHPGFWSRMEYELRRVAVPADPTKNMLGMNMSPIEIDAWEGDAPDTAAWRAKHWDRLRDAVEAAMVPLPEWLRAAPRFSNHG